MSANGISTLSTKEARQLAKLDIAQAKRQGKTVDRDGTITGSVDSSKPYYRTKNVYDIDTLPTKFNDNAVVKNTHAAGLLPFRPWTTSV